MEAVKLKYRIPRNNQELERLVGTSVGIKINSSSPTEPVVYFGEKDNRYLFLVQAQALIEEEDFSVLSDLIPTNKVNVYRIQKDSVRFSNGGVIIPHNVLNIDTISPTRQDYQEKLALLKLNNLWSESY